jgi:hypothetical protein
MTSRMSFDRIWLCVICGSLLLIGLTVSAWAHSSEAAAPPLTDIEFSVGTSAPGVGAAGSGVAAEAAAEAIGLDPSPGQTEDDIYLQSFPIAPPFPLTNGKFYDDGGPTAGAPPGPPKDLTIRTAGDVSDVDAYAIMNTRGASTSPETELIIGTPLGIAAQFVQFSVDTAAVGVAGVPPDVASEAILGEASGDVFEAGPIAPGGGGTNRLISDEGAHGLLPSDDLDGLIVNDPSGMVPPTIDTDGDPSSVPDMPPVFFSFRAGATFPATVTSGADICIPGTAPGVGTPAADPKVVIPPLGLGLVAGDDVDALWMDGFAHVIFSLAPGSPSLTSAAISNPFVPPTGATPGDLIHVSLSYNPLVGPPAAPATGPTVAALSTDLGLAVTDNLNALWITSYSLSGPLVPVELSIFKAE